MLQILKYELGPNLTSPRVVMYKTCTTFYGYYGAHFTDYTELLVILYIAQSHQALLSYAIIGHTGTL